MIEPPWWIGSRNLTDSDKRLFGVACSIKQHPLLPPPLQPHSLLLSSTITSPLFISPSFGLLCCHGYPQPTLLCGVRSCQGSALRSPDAGCLHQWPPSHATSFNLALIKSALPLCSRERLLSFCLQASRFSNLVRLVLREGKKEQKYISQIQFPRL